MLILFQKKVNNKNVCGHCGAPAVGVFVQPPQMKGDWACRKCYVNFMSMVAQGEM